MSDVTTIPADVPAPYAGLAPPRHVAIMGYLSYSDATETAVPELGRELGEPYSFATLIRAQADGDLQTLHGHGLDAARVHVEHTDQIKELL